MFQLCTNIVIDKMYVVAKMSKVYLKIWVSSKLLQQIVKTWELLHTWIYTNISVPEGKRILFVQYKYKIRFQWLSYNPQHAYNPTDTGLWQ